MHKKASTVGKLPILPSNVCNAGLFKRIDIFAFPKPYFNGAAQLRQPGTQGKTVKSGKNSQKGGKGSPTCKNFPNYRLFKRGSLRHVTPPIHSTICLQTDDGSAEANEVIFDIRLCQRPRVRRISCLFSDQIKIGFTMALPRRRRILMKLRVAQRRKL